MADHTAIMTYYARYDVKSFNHQITDENLLMVPANNEFRREKFSQISSSCVIALTQGESKNEIQQHARNAALKKILRNNGLKSVKTINNETIISYEGVIITPILIIPMPVNDATQFSYTAQFEFSPITFPDKWQAQKISAMIKEKIHDFILLFK